MILMYFDGRSRRKMLTYLHNILVYTLWPYGSFSIDNNNVCLLLLNSEENCYRKILINIRQESMATILVSYLK